MVDDPSETSAVARVLHFWFADLTPGQWFTPDDSVDRRIAQQFGDLYARLATGVPTAWRERADGVLAAVIVLDQFPRNMFRGLAQAFATDAMALTMAEEGIARGFDRELSRRQRQFLFLPYMHSEDPVHQARSIALFAALEDPEALDFARRHQIIIARFGRFPHRNAALGRLSTPEELAFLAEPGSSF
jgi:uncharacterized protein (DUF924 family)